MKILILTLTMLMFLGLDCKKKTIEPQDTYHEPKTTDDESSWSPDGQWIVYLHEDHTQTDTTYQTGLYIIDTNGNNRRLLLKGEALSPDWSPDGKWIAISTGNIYAINFNGDSIYQITPFGGWFPSWSPDGKKIVFDTPYQDERGAKVIWTINADGTNPEDISQHQVGEWRDADWSPDGSRLVHYRYIGIGTPEIFTMDTSGKNPIRLTNNNNFDLSPSWSDDGKMIVWEKQFDGPKDEIWLMNKDGTNQRKLHSGSYPAWSNDSRRIVFSDFNKNKTKLVLWTININGSQSKQITQ